MGRIFDRTRGGGPSRREVLAAGATLLLASQSRAAFAAAPDEALSMRVIESGHSLTDPIVPTLNAILASLHVRPARPLRVDKSTIPGSPLEWRWNNRVESGPDARHDIADYDMQVITERVSLANTLPWHDSKNYSLKFFENAWKNGRGGQGAPTILYATWVEVTSGPGFANPNKDPEGNLPFRERLPLEMDRWQEIADFVNSGRPEGSPEMRVIPGPLIMAAVYDAIEAGTAPGLTAIEQLFADEIHVNEAGAYLITLAHYAVLYGRDPRKLTGRIGDLQPKDTALTDWMKQIVHDVLSSYPGAGYSA